MVLGVSEGSKNNGATTTAPSFPEGGKPYANRLASQSKNAAGCVEGHATAVSAHAFVIAVARETRSAGEGCNRFPSSLRRVPALRRRRLKPAPPDKRDQQRQRDRTVCHDPMRPVDPGNDRRAREQYHFEDLASKKKADLASSSIIHRSSLGGSDAVLFQTV